MEDEGFHREAQSISNNYMNDFTIPNSDIGHVLQIKDPLSSERSATLDFPSTADDLS